MAYAGPAVLTLRSDIGSKSAPVGTVKHGERLELVDMRRRTVKVRAASGLEGWTDLSMLLSEQQMADLRSLAAMAAKLPSEGVATVYEPLNIHAEPYRSSPSFAQVTEGMTVDVVQHRVSPHGSPPAPPKPVVQPRASVPKKAPAKKKKASVLPLPTPPAPPANLVEISRPRASDLVSADAKPAGPAGDDWVLIRTKEGAAGWVLERPLAMKIPDEVAQYAERHRITAYLPLGEVDDKENQEVKQNWLWTTASENLLPYEFDSFRVFVWSIKHHRYETAYIERNVKGYYPVETIDLPGETEKGFTLVLEDKDGQKYKETYGFSGYRVHMISKVPYQAAPPPQEVRSAGQVEQTSTQTVPGWSAKLRAWRKKLLGI